MVVNDFKTSRSIATAAISKNERSILCQLKFGTLPLALETGRYQGLPVEKRQCKTCHEKDAVEDELHFMFVCKGLNEEREKNKHLLPENTAATENTHESSRTQLLHYLREMYEAEHLPNTAKFIYQLTMKRKEILYHKNS